MSWPSSTEYFEAVQVPAHFGDPELRQGQVAANAIGLPKACTGNFADVYQICCANNQTWAIKCFTREIPGLQLRYQLLSDHLRKIKFPFTVDFHYLEQGIRVRGQWYPMLKMRWVEGLTLNSLLRDQLDKPHRLRSLSLMWIRLAKNLRAGGIAHGDLQHGNVLLVPNADGTSLRLTLIDYDGMIVPALANQPSGEVGHPSYQHPERLAKRLYNTEVDRFSHLVICTALHCLMVGGKSLWDRYDNGDNLLFGKDDFADPGASPLFRELWRLPTPFANSLVGNLILACKGPMAQVPLIEKLFLDENTVARLTAEQQQAIAKVMELKAATPVAIPMATAQAVKAGEWWKSAPVSEKAAPSTPATVAAEKARQAAQVTVEAQSEPRPGRPRWPYFIYAVYLFLVAAIFFAPVVMAVAGGQNASGIAFLAGGVYFWFVVLGALLMAVPITRDWVSPGSRGSIVRPLIGSVICALALLGGAALASQEFWAYPKNETGESALILVLSLGAGASWATWFVLLCYFSRSVDPATFSGRLAQWLLGGSLLELLVAIPMHMIVRRRPECSTGMATGFAIGLGIFVALIALGPAVFFLCYRRYKQVYAGRRK